MATIPKFPGYLSRRARFERLETPPPAPAAQDGDQALDLTVTQPERAHLRCLAPSWLSGLPRAPYDPDPRGLHTAREVLARYLSGRAKVSADQLLLTASTSEAYAYLLLALCDPGDCILVPTPGYPLLDDLSQLLGVRLLRYTIGYDGAWYIDLATLPDRAQLQEQRVRFVVAISPHNPTGHVMSSAEARALLALGLPLVVDEVFSPYVWGKSRTDFDPLVSAEDTPLVLVLSGLSKSAAAAGLKLGWVCARGTHAAEFLCELEYVSDAFLSVNQLVQQGLPDILAQVPRIHADITKRILHNVQLVSDVFAQSAVTVLPMRAGWSIVLRLPDLFAEEEWLERMILAGVKVQAGRLFELPWTSVVVSALTVPALMQAGLDKIRKVVDAAMTT